MDKKLDKIADDISEIKTQLAVYNEQLKYHIKRSDQADSAIKLLEERVKPVEKHVIFLNNVSKFIALIASVVVFIATIYKYVLK